MRWWVWAAVVAFQLLVVLSVRVARRFDWLPHGIGILKSSAFRMSFLGLYFGTWMGVLYYYGQGESALNAVLSGLVTGLAFSLAMEWSRRRREKKNLH